MSVSPVNRSPDSGGSLEMPQSSELIDKTQDAAAAVLSRPPSPTPSDDSVDWSDVENLTSKKPKDIFEEDPGDPEAVFREWGYDATKQEWEEIIEAGATGPYGGLESDTANFALVKLAMKQLNPKLFWQSVEHLNDDDLRKVRLAVRAFQDLLNSFE